MKISELAKILVCTSFLITPTYAWQVVPQFECGTYLVSGSLEKNDGGDFLLVLRKDSSSPFELVLLGGDFDEKLSKTTQLVTTEVYVPKPIRSNHRPFVFLQEIKDIDFPLLSEPKRIRKEACGNRKKFR